ncbi:MAG TPA: hypothetical protein VEU33_33265 [Archangium sp.]|nr:hypothetical protein [Archangium sp.]
MRESYAQLYGPPSMPLLSSLESSRWFHALKLSPRYMDEGVRAAAMELLGSPTVAYSMALSMMLYMAAWAAPEPVFSKALAAAVTLGLLMTYSAAELYTVGQACLNLYREAEAARTQEQLEAAAERFGRAIGGVGLRVLVTVAGAKLAKGLPEVPKGGMWARFSPPRFAFAGGGYSRWFLRWGGLTRPGERGEWHGGAHGGVREHRDLRSGCSSHFCPDVRGLPGCLGQRRGQGTSHRHEQE